MLIGVMAVGAVVFRNAKQKNSGEMLAKIEKEISEKNAASKGNHETNQESLAASAKVTPVPTVDPELAKKVEEEAKKQEESRKKREEEEKERARKEKIKNAAKRKQRRFRQRCSTHLTRKRGFCGRSRVM